MPREVPTAYDLEKFLFAAGMIANNPTTAQHYLDLDLAIDSAYEDWQKDTGIKPFFAETSDTTRHYVSQGGRILSIHPYFSITRVHRGYSYETTSESQTTVTDYELPEGDAPYRELTFFYSLGPGERIWVTGKRGWSNDFPANAFRAILGQAAGVHLGPSISAAINSGAVSWKEGDVSETYGDGGAYSKQCEAWVKSYWMAVKQYKQVSVYGARRL